MRKIFKFMPLSLMLGWSGVLTLQADTGITESDFTNYGLFEYQGLPYHVMDDGTAEICNVDNIQGGYVSGNSITMENVVIPAEVSHNGQSYRVTKIGDQTFQGCTSVKTVVIPEGVTEIGYQAFYNATNVQWPKMPSTLREIKGNCFYMCRNLGKIVLPEGLTTLWNGCFTRTFDMGGHISEIVFPGTLTTITNDWNEFGQLCSDRKAGTVDRIVFNANPDWESLKFSFGTFSRGVNCKEIVINRDLVDYDAKWDKVNLGNVTGLETLRFGATVTQVPDLSGCSSLTTIYCDAPTPPAGLILPENAAGTITLVVPEAYAAAYRSDALWSALLPKAPSPVNAYANMAKIGYTVGEGALSGALLISWNDGDRKGVDHLVYGVRFDKGATPAEIIASAVEADSRLYSLEGHGYAYDNMDKGSIIEKYDHHCIDNEQYRWNVYSDDEPGEGSVIYLCYEPTGKDTSVVPDKPAYTFYIPEESVMGARFPENYEMPIADEMIIPIWARSGGVGGTYALFSWDAYPFQVNTQGKNQGEQAEGRAYASVEFRKVTFNDDPNHPGIHRYVPGPRDVMASVKLCSTAFGPGSDTTVETAWSGKMPMKIVAPLKPITKITDTSINVNGTMASTPLKELVKYEPADATYTDFFLEVFDKDLNAHSFYRQDVFPAPYTDEATDHPGYDYWLKAMAVSSGAKSTVFNVKYFYNLEETADNVYTQTDGVEGMLSFNVTENPAKAVALEGDYQYNITVGVHDILALKAKAMPASASQNVVMSIENTTVDNMANTYSVSGYMPDGNTAGNFMELVTYKAGEFDLVLRAAEKPDVTRTYHVTVTEADLSNAPEEYTDGTFWLNEEWFTHKNGSINYLMTPDITTDADIIYNPYSGINGNKGFGATSQYGMIFADKLFVMSKQEKDQGDIRGDGGGRLVVADATTLNRIASFDEIGGDGRACVGVGSHKAYIGHHAGIRVLTWDDADNMTLAESDIEGIVNRTEGDNSSIGGNQALYNKQIGDMVASRDHAYAIQQGVGLHIIDTQTDELVKTIEDPLIGAITQSADGAVWYATGTGASADHTVLHRIDPTDIEAEERTVEVPGVISTSWGAWRSANFFSARDRQMLFWNGTASSIMASGNTVYAWDTESDATELQPLFTFSGVKEVSENLTQEIYGTMRYDDRTDCILFASTTTPGANYRYNWLNFYDVANGTLKSVRLKDYYWFPSIPIFPDKFSPKLLTQLDSIELADEQPRTITLEATDQDSNDANIRFNIVEAARLRAPRANQGAAIASINGNTLTLQAVKTGEHTFTLAVESNGKQVLHNVNVKVTGTVGIDATEASDFAVRTDGHSITATNCNGVTFKLYTPAGAEVDAFRAESDNHIHHTTADTGIYILTGSNGYSTKVTIR